MLRLGDQGCEKAVARASRPCKQRIMGETPMPRGKIFGRDARATIIEAAWLLCDLKINNIEKTRRHQQHHTHTRRGVLSDLNSKSECRNPNQFRISCFECRIYLKLGCGQAPHCGQVCPLKRAEETAVPQERRDLPQDFRFAQDELATYGLTTAIKNKKQPTPPHPHKAGRSPC